MKKTISALVVLALAQWFAWSALAVEFFDITGPAIRKADIHVAAQQSTAKNQAFVQRMNQLLDRSLLFNVQDSGQATFTVTIQQTVESGQILFRMEEPGGQSGFEPITFGVRFRSQEPEYLQLKTAQVANQVVQQLFNIPGNMGSQIAWSSAPDGDPAKVLMLKDFGFDNAQQLTFNLFSNSGATWNPARDTIVYTSQTDAGSAVFMQQTNPLRVKAVRVYDNEGRGSAAFWGPSGNVFLAEFVSNRNTDIFEYRMPADDVYAASNPQLEQVRRVTDGRTVETEPAVSPDGNWIAYISDRTGGPQVYLTNLRTGDSERLTRTGGYNASPDWSPDGRWIAYFGIRGGQSSIYRMNLQTREETRVTPQSIQAEQPTWSPDGSMMAFTGERGDSPTKIYYILATGGEYRRLTDTGDDIEETDPSWGSALR